MSSKNQDIFLMKRAFKEARKARFRAPPNPWVGAVIEKNGIVVGKGSTETFGGPHAEIRALAEACEKAKGSTLYVTLEPCCHKGKTGACTEAIVKAGVARVVIGILDPDQNVAGKGVKRLLQAGIEVETGILKKEIEENLAPYLHQRRTNEAYVLAKAAVSVDGRLAATDGSSTWITGEKARNDVQTLRGMSQAILVGSETALKDQPRLTLRGKKKPSIYYRAFVDRSGRVPAIGPLFDSKLGPTLAFTTPSCALDIREKWQEKGVEVIVLPTCSPTEIVQFFSKKGVLQLLLEGGGALFTAFLQEKKIQRLSLYVGPRILGSEGIPLFQGLPIPNMKQAPILRFLNTKRLGDSARIDFLI